MKEKAEGAKDLAGQLRTLTRDFEAAGGTFAEVEDERSSDNLAPEISQALEYVAGRLVEASTRARSTVLRIHLETSGDRIDLKIIDDGAGLLQRFGQEEAFAELDALKSALRPVNGHVGVHSRRPRGALVDIAIPVDENPVDRSDATQEQSSREANG
jgi:signal transduction histidine kinase